MQGKEKVQSSLFGTRPLAELLPQDHPLRKIRALAHEAWGNLVTAFDTAYGTVGNVSCPPALLLRAHLLRALYSVRSERALCEQIRMNLAFRWFVGLDWEDRVFDATTFTKNRERLFGLGGAEALLGEVVRQVQKRGLAQSDRLVVDGTLLKAWASHKSFRPKDEEEPPRSGLHGFKGMKRSNATHESKTDPDARLFRKGDGMEALLCHLASVVVDAASGFVMGAKVSAPCGTGTNAEVDAALELAEEHIAPGQTLVGDRGYDTRRFTDGVRKLGVRAHPRAKSRGSSLDGRTTSRESYKVSMKLRHVVERAFAWIKGEGRMGQTKLRGTEKVGWEFHVYCAAYNLRMMAKLCP